MKHGKLKILFLIVFLGNLFLPSISLAGTYQICESVELDPLTGEPLCFNPSTVTYDGLVPCGKEVTVNGGTEVIPCQLCHFFVMLDEILDFILFILVPIVAVLMLMIGGVMFFFAGGSPQTLGKAKSIITSTIMGLVIIFAAWVIINTFFVIIGVNNWTGLESGWFAIDCPIIVP